MAMLPELVGLECPKEDMAKNLQQINYHMYLAHAKAVKLLLTEIIPDPEKLVLLLHMLQFIQLQWSLRMF